MIPQVLQEIFLMLLAHKNTPNHIFLASQVPEFCKKHKNVNFATIFKLSPKICTSPFPIFGLYFNFYLPFLSKLDQSKFNFYSSCPTKVIEEVRSTSHRPPSPPPPRGWEKLICFFRSLEEDCFKFM